MAQSREQGPMPVVFKEGTQEAAEPGLDLVAPTRSGKEGQRRAAPGTAWTPGAGDGVPLCPNPSRVLPVSKNIISTAIELL